MPQGIGKFPPIGAMAISAPQLLKSFFVQLNAVQIKADQKFFAFVFGSVFHQGLQQEHVERRGIAQKQTLRNFFVQLERRSDKLFNARAKS